MLIWNETPPNYDQIVEAFPFASRHTTIFAYAPDIYAPGAAEVSLSPHLIAHEEVHIERQGNDPDAWWDQYLTDEVFRFNEETRAHVAEAQSILDKIGWNRKNRKRVAIVTGARLAAPLYGYSKEVTAKKCEKFIYHLLTMDTDECCGQGCDEVFK